LLCVELAWTAVVAAGSSSSKQRPDDAGRLSMELLAGRRLTLQ
jgi:hypothetical protein